MRSWRLFFSGAALCAAMAGAVPATATTTQPGGDLSAATAERLLRTCREAGKACLVDRRPNPVQVWEAPHCGWIHLPPAWRGKATHAVTSGNPLTPFHWINRGGNQWGWQAGQTIPAWSSRDFNGVATSLHAVRVEC